MFTYCVLLKHGNTLKLNALRTLTVCTPDTLRIRIMTVELYERQSRVLLTLNPPPLGFVARAAGTV